MKQDRLSSLRQRLKRGSFEFGALLEGVSTLEAEEAPAEMPESRISSAAAPPADPLVPAPQVSDATEETLIVPMDMPELTHDEELMDLAPLIELANEAFSEPQAALPGLLALDERHSELGSTAHDVRLRSAIDALGCRFLQQMGSLRAALLEHNLEEAGFHLAHLNQVLELLRDLDPTGSVAREFGAVAAPPPGRAWPAAAWTVAELACSPISGLLPPNADEALVKDILYAAWGVAFESAP